MTTPRPQKTSANISHDEQNRRSEALFCQWRLLEFTHEQPADRPPAPGGRLRRRLACAPRFAGRCAAALDVPAGQAPGTGQAWPSAEAQLDALSLRLLADAEQSEATVDSGAATAADWLAIETRQVRRDARSDLKLATKLERPRPARRRRWRPGRSTSPRPARSSPRSTGCRAPASSRSPPSSAAAEAHLVALAAQHDAKALRVLGRQVFEVIAPDLAEQFEGRALEGEEAEALRRTTFTMWEDDEGTAHGRFRIPARHGQMLRKMILAVSSPTVAARHRLARDRARPAHPGARRDRVHRADRVHPAPTSCRRPVAAVPPWWSP